MKFHCFHLMPYPDLPADLKQRFRSVWIEVPQCGRAGLNPSGSTLALR